MNNEINQHLSESKDKYILFLGDSYCASLNRQEYYAGGKHPWQVCYDSECHPSLVADHYRAQLVAHGYGGKSWWYSRSELEKHLQQQPDLLDKIDAMVFFHTDWMRINTDVLETTVSHNCNTAPDTNNVVAQAQQSWFKYLCDENYQKWSGQHWFEELSRRFSNKKQVHFHCLQHTLEYNHLLRGQKFTTPLAWISVGELTGTSEQILEKISHKETRANHLSPANNRALANIIICALDNYQEQSQEIDLSGFEIVNPNYKNFGNGNFGTD